MRPLPLKEQTLFLKRLAFLLQAHIPLVDALLSIKNQTRSKGNAKRIWAAAQLVSEGKPLAEALHTQRLLSNFSLHLIHVGEISGNLSANLTYLADELYKKQQLRRKVQSALWYPLCISVVTLGITGALITYIFPKLMPIFVSMGTELPPTTRALIHTASFLQAWWWALLLVIALGIPSVIFAYRRIPQLRRAGDVLLLYTPLVGGMTRRYHTATTARTLALLLKSHVPLLESLKTCAHTSSNSLYARALSAVATRASRGKALSPEFACSPKLFPDLFVHLVAIGESSGNIEETLQYLAVLYEAEVDEYSKNITNAVEPILMLTMGALVGLIAVSVITPIYSITEHLQTT